MGAGGEEYGKSEKKDSNVDTTLSGLLILKKDMLMKKFLL